MLFVKSHKTLLALLLLVLLIMSLLVVRHLISQKEASTPYMPLSRLQARSCGDFFQSEYDVSCFYYRTHDKGGFKLPLVLIRYGVQPQVSSKVDRELIVYIPGGPGQGHMTTADEITYWAEWLRENEQQYDLLLFDPRGTGESIPSARCDRYHSVAVPLLATAGETENELLQMNGMLSKCFDAYTKTLKRQFPGVNGAEIYDVFATQNQADDINGMVTSLGYERAHLWGVSYGTRLALASARFDVVKTLILDSFYSLSKGLTADWIALYRESFTLHGTLYSEYLNVHSTRDGSIKDERYKDESYSALYRKALNTLQNNPLKVNVERWSDGKKIDFVLTQERLLELSFSGLYSPQRYSDFYVGLAYFVETGKANAEFLGVLEYFINNVLDQNFSFLTYYAVECLDNRPQSISRDDVSFDEFPIYESYFYLGFKHTICDHYGFTKGLDVQQMVSRDNEFFSKPMLIFSGEYDPVTPSTWAEALAEKHQNMQHVILKNSGHAQLRGQKCDWRVLNTFIREQDPSVDFQCEAHPLWQ